MTLTSVPSLYLIPACATPTPTGSDYNDRHGNKWTLDNVRLYLEAVKGPEQTKQIFREIEAVIVKSLKACQVGRGGWRRLCMGRGMVFSGPSRRSGCLGKLWQSIQTG